MKIVIFTTPTKHHTYFVNKISEKFDIAAIVHETRKLKKPYATGPFFDKEEDEHEELFFNSGIAKEYPDHLKKSLISVDSVNSKAAYEQVKALEPDLIIVFGTGIIYPEIIDIPKWGMINMHGGLTQYYRGLDSTLWAFYNKEFDKLGITIHYVESELDSGGIISQANLAVEKDDQIYHFRYKIAKKVTEMTLELLDKFKQAGGPVEATAMNPKGEYFSAMDIKNKDLALDNFNQYKQER